MQIEADLRVAASNNEFVLYYQPKQSLVTGLICGAEALIRWNHPKCGLLLPGEFIAIAEEINSIEEIEKWVLGNVCGDMARWHSLQLPLTQVSVNVSSKSLDSPVFAEFMQALLKEHKISAGQLLLELPESFFLLMDESRMLTLSRLYEAGIGIIMDKFDV